MAKWYIELSTTDRPLFTVKEVNGKEKAIEEAMKIVCTKKVIVERGRAYPKEIDYDDTLRCVYVTDKYGYAAKEYRIK